MDYTNLIEEVKEIHDRLTIVGGYLDIYKTKNSDLYHIKDVDCFWILIGRASYEDVKLCLMESEYKVDKEGCYQVDIVLKYDPDDRDEYGRVISGGYWYIECMYFVLDHTFDQRERDHKISNLLDDNINFDIFNI